jgi:hypothetical protein
MYSWVPHTVLARPSGGPSILVPEGIILDADGQILGQAKVGNADVYADMYADVSVAAQQYVLGLQIPVEDSEGVQIMTDDPTPG